MAIQIWIGKPGHGKTIALMRKFVERCKHSEKLFKETGVRRPIKTCILPSPVLYARYAFFIEIFSDIDWLPQALQCDIFIDEMGSYFDARQWATLGPEVIHALRVHRHKGIEIFGATQELTQVDVTIRRLTTRVYRCKKLFSTGEPQPGKKKRFSYMFGQVGEVLPEHREIETEFQETENNTYNLYDADDFGLYDTHQTFDIIPLSPIYLRPRQVVKLDDDGTELSREKKWGVSRG